MNNIVPFNFEDQQVRTLDRNGEPWFVAVDVCRVLEIGNPSDAVARLDGDEVTLDSIEGNHRPTNLINESGLYALILTSKKPQAKPFRKWVTSEVLPSIRKSGRYEHQPQSPIIAIPNQDLVNGIFVVQSVAEILRVSEASKIKMLGTILKAHKIPDAVLPAYTEEKSTKSLTELLEIHGANMTARNANKILLEAGILEIKDRPGTKKDKSGNSVKITKQFKSLTEKGLRFGKNVVSPQNERETQPHYFEDTFHELLELIADQMDVAA